MEEVNDIEPKAEQDRLPCVPDEDAITWGEAVARLKVKAQLRGALAAGLVEANPDLLKVVLVWPMIPLTRNESVNTVPNIRKGATEDARLHKIAWNGVTISYPKIQEYIGLKKPVAKPLIEQAKSLGMVWPDGTINATLLAYLTQKLGPEMVTAITTAAQ